VIIGSKGILIFNSLAFIKAAFIPFFAALTISGLAETSKPAHPAKVYT
jgi:hypothetical protein